MVLGRTYPSQKETPQHSEVKKKLFSWHMVVSSYYLKDNCSISPIDKT